MQTEKNATLFSELSSLEEETLSGGLSIFKRIGRFFKHNAGTIAIGGVGLLAAFFGGSGKTTYSATTTDGQHRIEYTP